MFSSLSFLVYDNYIAIANRKAMTLEAGLRTNTDTTILKFEQRQNNVKTCTLSAVLKMCNFKNEIMQYNTNKTSHTESKQMRKAS